MNEQTPPVIVDLRIPGPWSHPRQFEERMPDDCRLTPESIILADGTEIELGMLPPDDQFAQIFRLSCRNPATDEELAIVDNFQVNITLSGPGGSMEAAHKMMRAAAAIIQAGGGGVFIDNSALAHGGEQWLAMTEDADADDISYAFVAIVGSRDEIWTLGMHVLGLRDIVMKRSDNEDDGFNIVEVIRYMCNSERPIDDGHILADLGGPRFKVRAEPSSKRFEGSAMHNAYGRFKLINIRDIAETN